VWRRGRDRDTAAVRLENATYRRHGSLRRLGQGGRPPETLTPGTSGRISADGIRLENAIQTRALPEGLGWLKDHTGWVPFGAAITTRIRDPAR
jgi:hypothetical protein